MRGLEDRECLFQAANPPPLQMELKLLRTRWMLLKLLLSIPPHLAPRRSRQSRYRALCYKYPSSVLHAIIPHLARRFDVATAKNQSWMHQGSTRSVSVPTATGPLLATPTEREPSDARSSGLQTGVKI